MTATSFQVWGPLAVAAVVTALLTPIAVWAAPKIGAMDVPKDSRRIHNKPMPRFGGGNRVKKKQGIIARLIAFFEKYFGL